MLAFVDASYQIRVISDQKELPLEEFFREEFCQCLFFDNLNKAYVIIW
jgi:hypothetical protein